MSPRQGPTGAVVIESIPRAPGPVDQVEIPSTVFRVTGGTAFDGHTFVEAAAGLDPLPDLLVTVQASSGDRRALATAPVAVETTVVIVERRVRTGQRAR
jgi:hypothetical protein